MKFFAFNLENFTPDRIFLHGHRPWCPWQLWGMAVFDHTMQFVCLLSSEPILWLLKMPKHSRYKDTCMAAQWKSENFNVAFTKWLQQSVEVFVVWYKAWTRLRHCLRSGVVCSFAQYEDDDDDDFLPAFQLKSSIWWGQYSLCLNFAHNPIPVVFTFAFYLLPSILLFEPHPMRSICTLCAELALSRGKDANLKT